MKSKHQQFAVLAFSFVLFTFTSSSLYAALACKNIFLRALQQPTINQWLQWETLPTVPGWDQERPSSPLPIVSVPRKSVNIEGYTSSILGLEAIQKKQQGSKIPWFNHPYNQDTSVPHSKLKPVEYGVAYHTASRTIVTEINGQLFAIKMPTDHPFGPTKQHQPGKTRMDADLKYSVARTKAIEKIDETLGADSGMLVQKEILAVTDKRTGNGYLIRDLSILQDGNYYLPAHLLPLVGKELAQKQGSSVAHYWQKHWAESIGRYQAKLLYRYGIEVRAVNPQNFLIQLDQNMQPTGVIVWRDLAESHLVEQIASKIGLSSFIERDMANGGWGVHDYINLDNVNISWRFNDSTPTLTPDQQAKWSIAHDKAYKKELEDSLGISIPQNVSLKEYLNNEVEKGSEHSLLIKKILEWQKANGNQEVGWYNSVIQPRFLISYIM